MSRAKHHPDPFTQDESGTVTVEWVLLTALGAAVAIAATEMVTGGLSAFASTISHYVTGESDEEYLTHDIANGSFETVAGLTEASWGYVGRSVEGWTEAAGLQFEIKANGLNGTDAGDGSTYLDMGESPGNMEISQTFADTVTGEPYVLAVSAFDSVGDNSVEVFWGGEIIGVIDPSVEGWQDHAFELQGGSGDGSNTLVLKETGAIDNTGTYIDDVRLYRTR